MSEGMNFNKAPSAGKPESGSAPMSLSDIQRLHADMQRKTAIHGYLRENPTLGYDPEKLDAIPEEVKNAAMMHYIKTGAAERFRQAVESNEIDLNTDREGLRSTLEDLGVTNQSLH